VRVREESKMMSMMSRWFRQGGAGCVVLLVGVAGACSSEDAASVPSVPSGESSSSVDSEVVPVVSSDESIETSTSSSTTSSTTVVPVIVDSTSSVPGESVPSSEVSVPVVERVRQLPDELGPLLDVVPFDDAPEVSNPGEIIEIYPMGYLYVPDRYDESEPSALPMREGDAEIIAAYARARAAVRNQNSVFPVMIEPSAEVQAAFVDGGQQTSEGQFTRRNEEGTLIGSPFERPDIYRPYVLAEPRSETSATVWDCRWVSSSVVNPDGSEAFEGSTPYSVSASEAEMAKVDGIWKVVGFSVQEQACL